MNSYQIAQALANTIADKQTITGRRLRINSQGYTSDGTYYGSCAYTSVYDITINGIYIDTYRASSKKYAIYKGLKKAYDTLALLDFMEWDIIQAETLRGDSYPNIRKYYNWMYESKNARESACKLQTQVYQKV